MSLLAGLYDVAGEFDVIESAAVFLNSSFGTGKDLSQSGGNGPSIFPSTSAGVRIDAQPVENAYARIAVLDGVPGDSDDSDTAPDFFDFDDDEGVLCVAEAGYLAGEGGERRSRTPRSVSAAGTTPPISTASAASIWTAIRRSRDGNYGVYLLGERAVYREPQAPERGLAAFARVGFADSDVDPVGYYAGGRWPTPDCCEAVRTTSSGWASPRRSPDTSSRTRAKRRASMRTKPKWRSNSPIAHSSRPGSPSNPTCSTSSNPSFDPSVDDALALGARFEVAF